MTGTRDDFVATARAVAPLFRDPSVTRRWDGPSALAEFSAGGLAGHLAYQVLVLPDVLAAPEPTEPVITLLEHYGRVAWIGADLDAEINVRIRRGGDEIAEQGPDALADRYDAAVDELAAGLAAAAPDRTARISLWGPWSMRLDDLLVTRMMELAVHADDLAVSAGVETPRIPPTAVETVVDLLSRLAVRRHGPTAVLRALSRAERAPDTITAF
jgi:hypothetical protein